MSVRQSVGLSVTRTFDDPQGAPTWPTWPCFYIGMLSIFSASGDKCGVVRKADRESGKDLCYTKAEQKWPMQCKEKNAATPLPVDYESPSAPWEKGTIFRE